MTRAMRAAAGAALLVSAALAAAGVIAVRAWTGAAALFHPVRRTPVVWPGGDGPPAHLEPVTFDAAGASIRGWYVPGPKGTIILVHGSVADRTQLVPEARALLAAGYGVLLYDEPGAGESTGSVTFGAAERAALDAAAAWVTHRAPDRDVGAYGFSQGAYILAQAAVHLPAVRALVLAGPVGDLGEQTDYTFRRYGAISRWSARLARERAGWVPSDPAPLAVIGRLRRPVFIVSGGADREVPPDHAARLFAAASEPKSWWVVPGAGHGDYAAVAPAEYARRLSAFYDAALAPPSLPR